MNNVKTLEETLQPYIEKALKGLEEGTEFIIDQAPELVQQFYIYHWWSNFIAIIIGVILLIYGIIGMKIGFKDDDMPNALNLTGVISTLISLIIIALHLMPFIKICVAPKLYLIEYFIN